MDEIRNAKITSTTLGIEDHGIFTFDLVIEFGGCGCVYGGYALDSYDRKSEKRIGTGKSIIAIRSILETVGVDKWEDLKGTLIRVKNNGWGSSIVEIGNIMENKWFNISEFFKTESEEI